MPQRRGPCTIQHPHRNRRARRVHCASTKVLDNSDFLRFFRIVVDRLLFNQFVMPINKNKRMTIPRKMQRRALLGRHVFWSPCRRQLGLILRRRLELLNQRHCSDGCSGRTVVLIAVCRSFRVGDYLREGYCHGNHIKLTPRAFGVGWHSNQTLRHPKSGMGPRSTGLRRHNFTLVPLLRSWTVQESEMDELLFE